jgi:DNA repair photolyase
MNSQLIYEPAGRAREYAALACNVYRGCDHACGYCYAPAALRMGREQFAHPAPRAGFLDALAKEAPRTKPTEPILLCFTCDPYQALDERLGVTREAIRILHGAGHAVHILTKGGSRALRDADLLGERDAFATTLTLLDDDASYRWEPGAALPSDRIATIREFHRLGVPTWVSLEPVLDSAVALQIIRKTHAFVDLYKVGRWNYHADAKLIDWAKFAADATALLDSLGKRYYVKRDLACFLTPQHHSPLRVVA